jgi:V/A-type H+-transporting ATPase subunit K
MEISMIGPAIVLGLGLIGSSIGCTIPSMALHGVMTQVEEGHGKLIALSIVPSSQSIYAFVFMILMKGCLVKGSLTPIGGVGIGLMVGLALMFSSIYQGKCGATAIQASARQPAIYGKSTASLFIVESFSLFAFVFGLLLIY